MEKDPGKGEKVPPNSENVGSRLGVPKKGDGDGIVVYERAKLKLAANLGECVLLTTVGESNVDLEDEGVPRDAVEICEAVAEENILNVSP